MPDFGGFFSAFMAAKDAGKKGGGQQPGGPQGYPGAVEDHPGWDYTTGCCSAHPQGCADSATGGGHPWKGGEGFGGGSGQGDQQSQQGNAWGGGRGFGK